jgi:hypothetical protein
VVKYFEGNKYAIVEDILTDGENSKAECFSNTSAKRTELVSNEIKNSQIK